MNFNHLKIGQYVTLSVLEGAVYKKPRHYSGVIVEICADRFTLDAVTQGQFRFLSKSIITFTFHSTEDITFLSCIDMMDMGI